MKPPQTAAEKFAAYTNPNSERSKKPGEAAPALPSPKVDRLMAALAGARPKHRRTIPGTEIEADWQTPTALDSVRVEAMITDVRTEPGALVSKLAPERSYGHIETVRCACFLALLVTDPETGEPIGTFTSWISLGIDSLGACNQLMSDLREEDDPGADGFTPEEAAAIVEAVQKKRPDLLRGFGTRTLSSWLASTDGLLASYQQRSSKPGGSSSES